MVDREKGFSIPLQIAIMIVTSVVSITGTFFTVRSQVDILTYKIDTLVEDNKKLHTKDDEISAQNSKLHDDLIALKAVTEYRLGACK